MAGGHLPLALCLQKECPRAASQGPDTDGLDIEEELHGVFLDMGYGGELMEHPIYLHPGDSRPGQGTQKHPPQGIAQGGAKAPLQGLGHKFPVGGRALHLLYLGHDYLYHWSLLAGIVLHNGLLIDAYLNIASAGHGQHLSFQLLPIPAEPGGDRAGRGVFLKGLIETGVPAGLPEGNDIPYFDQAGGHISAPAAELDMSVVDNLAGLGAGLGEAQAVDHTVQPPLQELEEGLPCSPRGLGSLFKEATELPLQHLIDVAGLLFFPELEAPVGELALALAQGVHPGGRPSLVHGTLGPKTASPLEEELLSHSPAETTTGVSTSGHLYPPPFGGTATIVGDGSHIPDARDEKARRLEGPDGRLPPASRPLHPHLHLLESHLYSFPGGLLRGHLGSVGGPFPGTFETGGAGAGPGQDVTSTIRQGDHGVVEGGMDIGPAPGHPLLFPLSGPGLLLFRLLGLSGLLGLFCLFCLWRPFGLLCLYGLLSLLRLFGLLCLYGLLGLVGLICLLRHPSPYYFLP